MLGMTRDLCIPLDLLFQSRRWVMTPKGGAEMGFHFNILLSLEIEGGFFLFFYFLCLRGRPS